MPDKRSHRGPHPKDAELFGVGAVGKLRAAVGDYSLLLSKGYAAKSSLKLVGDRFGLTVRQRLALMRSACSDEQRSVREKNRFAIEKAAGGYAKPACHYHAHNPAHRPPRDQKNIKAKSLRRKTGQSNSANGQKIFQIILLKSQPRSRAWIASNKVRQAHRSPPSPHTSPYPPRPNTISASRHLQPPHRM